MPNPENIPEIPPEQLTDIEKVDIVDLPSNNPTLFERIVLSSQKPLRRRNLLTTFVITAPISYVAGILTPFLTHRSNGASPEAAEMTLLKQEVEYARLNYQANKEASFLLTMDQLEVMFTDNPRIKKTLSDVRTTILSQSIGPLISTPFDSSETLPYLRSNDALIAAEEFIFNDAFGSGVQEYSLPKIALPPDTVFDHITIPKIPGLTPDEAYTCYMTTLYAINKGATSFVPSPVNRDITPSDATQKVMMDRTADLLFFAPIDNAFQNAVVARNNNDPHFLDIRQSFINELGSLAFRVSVRHVTQ